MSKNTRVAVAGAAGRMGRTLVEACGRSDDVVLAAALEAPGKPFLGADAGALAGVGEAGVAIGDSLEKCAGAFDSELYGRLTVRHEAGGLTLTFGGFTTPLAHWQDDSYYVRAPTRLTFDWLLTFTAKGGEVASVTVKHIGWDKDEKDHVFARGHGGAKPE